VHYRDAENSTIMHWTTHRLLCSNFSPTKAFLSSPNHRILRISLWVTLAVPYSENGPQRDVFRNHGGHQIECDGRTPEDSKRSLPPVLPTMAGSMEQVCARARVLLWRWLGKCCHMSYHYSAIPQFRELFDCPSYQRSNYQATKCHILQDSLFSFLAIEMLTTWNGVLCDYKDASKPSLLPLQHTDSQCIHQCNIICARKKSMPFLVLI